MHAELDIVFKTIFVFLSISPPGMGIILVFEPHRLYKIRNGGVKYAGVRKISDFRPKTSFILETVTMDHWQRVVGSRSICIGSDDLE